MRRGTTPQHTFTLPFDTAEIEKIRVIYAQGDIVKVTKKETDCKLSENNITVKLTQAETLRFNHRMKTDIQLRVVTHDGEALASEIMSVPTCRCLDNEVL